MNANSVQPSARLGKSISRSTFAKPNPWIRPNAKAIQARVSRPPALTSRLSAPTYTMLSAIAGSMAFAGGITIPQRRQRQRDAVGYGKRGDDQQQLFHRAAEQEQARQEQQVIRTNKDVVDAGRDELLQHRPHTLPRA